MSDEIIPELRNQIRQGYLSWIQNIQFANPRFIGNEDNHYTPYPFEISVPSIGIRPEAIEVDKLHEHIITHLTQLEMAHFISHLRSLTLEITLKTQQNRLYETLEDAFTQVNEIVQPNTILIPRNRLGSFNNYIGNLETGQSVVLRDDLTPIVYEGNSNEFYIYDIENITKFYPRDTNQRLVLHIDHNEGSINPARFWGHIQQELRIDSTVEIARITVTT